MKTIKNIIGLRIKSARILKGWSMQDLTDNINSDITRQAIYRYEKCQVAPPEERLIEIAEALDKPLSFFYKPFYVNVELGEIHCHKINIYA